jgi:hypothetical protein
VLYLLRTLTILEVIAISEGFVPSERAAVNSETSLVVEHSGSELSL